jgi:hypothetical protein
MSRSATSWALTERLDPADYGALVAAFRGGRSLYLQGTPERFAGLFDVARLRAVLAAIDASPRPRLSSYGAVLRDPLGDGLTHTEALRPAVAGAPDPIDAVLAAGQTICATHIAPHDGALAAALAEIAGSLACPGDLRFNAYLSPAGAQTPWHTDVRISTSLQLSGRKRWRFQRRSAAVFPASNAQLDRWGEAHWMNPLAATGEPPPPPDRAVCETVTLAPGDMITVPAGAWHEVVTEEDALALNLSIRPTPMTAIARRLIDHLFGDAPAWRQGAPILGADARGGDGAPAEVRDYIAARVEELRARLDALDPGGAEVTELWRALLGASASTDR